MWQSIEVPAGATLKLGNIEPNTGSRAYLAFAGGLNVPVYLGSRATFPSGESFVTNSAGTRRIVAAMLPALMLTSLVCGCGFAGSLGGVQGRAIRSGDLVDVFKQEDFKYVVRFACLLDLGLRSPLVAREDRSFAWMLRKS